MTTHADYFAGSGDRTWPNWEIADLRARLAETDAALAALRSGAADALLGETGILYVNAADQTYVSFFGAMNEGGVTLDDMGVILHCNPHFASLMGQSVAALRGRALQTCVAAADRARVAALLAQDAAGSCEVTLAAAPPTGHPVQLSLTHIDTGRRRFGCLVVSDLVTRMKVERELERLVEERTGELTLAASVFENTQEGVMLTDLDGIIFSVNPAFTAITGYSAAEAIGRKSSLLRSQHHEPRFYQQLWERLRHEGRWCGEICNRRKSGETYTQWSTINLVPAQHGRPACYVTLFTDVTEFWRKDERIAHLAYHDPLTDLPNRNLLLDRLNHAISVADRQGDRLGVLFVDLDGFKAVNDNLGHHVGDQVLQHVAGRLAAGVRSSDTVARIGGDEFVVLMEKLESTAECAVLAGKLPSLLAWRGAAGAKTISVGASIGIAIYPDDGADAATLLQHADAALYAAKAAGKGDYRYFQTCGAASQGKERPATSA